MDTDIARLFEKLRTIGRIEEILDSDGRIQPSRAALDKAERMYADESDMEIYRIAQAQTVLDLAEKYQAELS